MMNKTEKRLNAGIVTVIILTVCLVITSLALLYASVSVENNIFGTGGIKINLNDGKPVIKEYEFLFEPGMKVQKEFFIENLGTGDAYYKLYFENVDGALADDLIITLKQSEKVLFNGKATSLLKENSIAFDDILHMKERKQLTITFYMPESTGNKSMNQYIAFDLSADAVQTKNNPYKVFN